MENTHIRDYRNFNINNRLDNNRPQSGTQQQNTNNELEHLGERFRSAMGDQTAPASQANIANQQVSKLEESQNQPAITNRMVQTDGAGNIVERTVSRAGGNGGDAAPQISERNLGKSAESNRADDAEQAKKAKEREAGQQMDLKIDAMIGMLQSIIARLGNDEATQGLKADLQAMLAELKAAKGEGVQPEKKSDALAKAQAVLAKVL